MPTEPPGEFEGNAEEWAAAVDGCDVPGRATLTTKRINDNQYLYRQWSEDGTTKFEMLIRRWVFQTAKSFLLSDSPLGSD